MQNYKVIDNEITFQVNGSIYDKEAVLRTAYLFTDRYYVYIDMLNADFVIKITSKPELKIESEITVGEFYNELLNNTLRIAIQRKTKQIRELILTRALYSSYIHQEEPIIADNLESCDLESIATDWFKSKQNE